MSASNIGFEQISEWALNLRFFRCIIGGISSPREELPAMPDHLTVLLKLTSEDDLIKILQHLGVPVIKSFSENLDLSRIGNESFEPVQNFPHLYIPQNLQINGARPTIGVNSRRLRLSLKIAHREDVPGKPSDFAEKLQKAAETVDQARQIETLLDSLADKIIDPPQDDTQCVCPKYYPEIWGLPTLVLKEENQAERSDRFYQLKEDANYRKCAVCSQLKDFERGFQKIGRDAEDTFLPDASKSLVDVREIDQSRSRSISQCPKCTTCYSYQTEYEFIYGGSEDSQYLQRLTAAETLKYLKESLRHRKPTVKGKYHAEPWSKISSESVYINTAEPELIMIRYSQLDDGAEMGGTLRLEKQNVGELIDTLLKCVYVYAQPETVIRRGADELTIYESGSDRQPFYNVLNRREQDAPGGGLSGLMMTRWAAEETIAKLLALPNNN
jgi:hypothetical protein